MRRIGLKIRLAALMLVLVPLVGSFTARIAFAMLDPGAVYCKALDYQLLRGQTTQGETILCELPNGQVVDAYNFFVGRVGLEWSYCATEGYQARRVENGALCKECTVCVLPDGTEATVTQLMGLDFRESHCGDGSCGTAENFLNCPQDCPSVSVDEECDGVQDGRCDPDCVEQGLADPDCPHIFVDIKAGSCPNPLETRSRGVLPLAILGTDRLDVTTINPAMVRVRRPDCVECTAVAPVRWSYEDVSAPYLGDAECGCGLMGPDGHLDLNLKFDRQELLKKLKLDQRVGDRVPVTVKGNLYIEYHSIPIRGVDCVDVLDRGANETPMK